MTTEYKRFIIPYGMLPSEKLELLNKFGQEGWELVHVDVDVNHVTWNTIWLKRKVLS